MLYILYVTQDSSSLISVAKISPKTGTPVL